ncbi:ATG13 [Branchiostoma lanceolatum]|uniref:ATG13 protein n=1 Tax=Branchiostoma lanceolatum TaxID=7740 RepID=A0A8J9YRY0_BRALA|nr:ATG13 [Branchiostoma lanceolatum]
MTENIEVNLSPQDKKDLDKYIKFLCLKSIQVIVQSRLGDKVRTKSKPSTTGADWFNLGITDVPRVLAEGKRIISGQLPSLGQSLCVEISLTTSEGDSMILETWCLGMNDRSEADIKVSYTVYNRMGILLRSLFTLTRVSYMVYNRMGILLWSLFTLTRVSYTVYNRMGILLRSLFTLTRVTPAYRLSRKQGTDFVIMYRIYFGDVKFEGLGEGFQVMRVGAVPTPIGTLTMSAAYRTKLTIPSEGYAGLQMKADHYMANTPPRYIGRNPSEPRFQIYAEDFPDWEDPLQEIGVGSCSVSPPNQMTFSRAATQTDLQQCATIGEQGEDGRHVNLSSALKVGAFALGKDVGKDGDGNVCNVPFELLTQQKTEPRERASSSPGPFADQPGLFDQSDCLRLTSYGLAGSTGSYGSQLSSSPQEDFVVVEVQKPAFGKCDSNSDLGTFYKECQNPPQLGTFADAKQPCVTDTLASFTEDLAKYEDNLDEFDEFVLSLQDDQMVLTTHAQQDAKQPCINDTLASFTEDLAKYEDNLDEFDEFVLSLQDDQNNTNFLPNGYLSSRKQDSKQPCVTDTLASFTEDLAKYEDNLDEFDEFVLSLQED